MVPAVTAVACAHCGRPTTPLEAHTGADVTTHAAPLCPSCWFDAGKE